MQDNNRGFTLTELLTTVATIGVVASLLLPAVSKVKNRARDVQCLNNQRSVRTVLESEYQDVVADYNAQFRPADIVEINNRFNAFCSSSLMKDPYLGDFGVYSVKPATCPYAFGDGITRAGYSTIFRQVEINGSMHYVPYVPESNKEVKLITYTYDLTWNFMDLREEHFVDPQKNEMIQIRPVVSDWLNNNKPYHTTIGNLFPQIKLVHDRSISFNNSVLHPHKGVGRYATFGNGEQKWEKMRY